MNTAMEMIDRIRDTTESHDRCSVVEVMGRRCGDIALNTGIAVGAIATLVPEVKYDFEKDIIERIRYAQKTGQAPLHRGRCRGRRSLRRYLQAHPRGDRHREPCDPILGHVQRGGSPTLRDRVVASQMGYHAVELLRDGKSNRVVVMQGERIVDFDITEALEMPACLRREALQDFSGSFPLKLSYRNACSKRTAFPVFRHGVCIFCIKHLVGVKNNYFWENRLTFPQFVVE